MERILSIVVINMRIFTAVFHKADYIFFLFTQLVNESCALHTAAWCLWHENLYGPHTNVPDHVMP